MFFPPRGIYTGFSGFDFDESSEVNMTPINAGKGDDANTIADTTLSGNRSTIS